MQVPFGAESVSPIDSEPFGVGVPGAGCAPLRVPDQRHKALYEKLERLILSWQQQPIRAFWVCTGNRVSVFVLFVWNRDFASMTLVLVGLVTSRFVALGVQAPLRPYLGGDSGWPEGDLFNMVDQASLECGESNSDPGRG